MEWGNLRQYYRVKEAIFSQEKYPAVWSMEFLNEHTFICLSSDFCCRSWKIKHESTHSTMKCITSWNIPETDARAECQMFVWKWNHHDGPVVAVISIGPKILFMCDALMIFTLSQNSSQIIQWQDYLIVLDKILYIFKIDEQKLMEACTKVAEDKIEQMCVDICSLVGQVPGEITRLATKPTGNHLWGWIGQKLVCVDLVTLAGTHVWDAPEVTEDNPVELFPFKNDIIMGGLIFCYSSHLQGEKTWAFHPESKQRTEIYQEPGKDFLNFGSNCFCYRGKTGFRETHFIIQNSNYEILFMLPIGGFVQTLAVWKNTIFGADLFRKLHARKGEAYAIGSERYSNFVMEHYQVGVAGMVSTRERP